MVPSGEQQYDAAGGAGAPAEYVAFDAATGDERWRVQVAQPTSLPGSEPGAGNAPGVFLDGVFYYADGPTIRGVDAATGEVRHEVSSERNVVVAGPVVAGGRIVVIAQPPFDPADPSYVRTAYVLTPRPHEPGRFGLPRTRQPVSLTASGDVLVAWGDSGYESQSLNVGIADGTLFAMGHGISIIDAATGEIVFEHPTVRAGGLVTSAAGHVVIYNHDGITGFE